MRLIIDQPDLLAYGTSSSLPDQPLLKTERRIPREVRQSPVSMVWLVNCDETRIMFCFFLLGGGGWSVAVYEWVGCS